MNGTGLKVFAVCGAPASALRVYSSLPWSAVMGRTYPAAWHAAYTVPTVASVAEMAEGREPVGPTYITRVVSNLAIW